MSPLELQQTNFLFANIFFHDIQLNIFHNRLLRRLKEGANGGT